MPEIGERRDTIVDGIYFNPVEGAAGTSWPVGSPEVPVNNFTDAVALMFARNLKKLYLVGGRIFVGTHTAANHPTIMTDANNIFTANTLVGLTIYNDTDGSTGVITANDEHTITVAALVGGGLNIWTTGDDYHVADALDNYPYRVVFDQNIQLELIGDGLYDVVVDDGVVVLFTNGLHCSCLINGTGELDINGNCHVTGILENGTGTIAIYGNCHVGVNLENGDGTISIHGNCHVGRNLTNGSSSFYTYGTCYVGHDLQNEGDMDPCRVQFTSSDPTMDLQLSGGSTTFGIVSRGSLQVSQMAAGDEAIIDLCGGILTIAADCTGGTINLYGDCGLNDLSGAAVTVNDNRIPGHL